MSQGRDLRPARETSPREENIPSRVKLTAIAKLEGRKSEEGGNSPILSRVHARWTPPRPLADDASRQRFLPHHGSESRSASVAVGVAALRDDCESLGSADAGLRRGQRLRREELIDHLAEPTYAGFGRCAPSRLLLDLSFVQPLRGYPGDLIVPVAEFA